MRRSWKAGSRISVVWPTFRSSPSFGLILASITEGEPLVIDAKIKPNDGEDLKVGQTTEIRLPAFHDRRMPALTGVVSKISADSFVDEKSGAAFYNAEITVAPSQLRLIQN